MRSKYILVVVVLVILAFGVGRLSAAPGTLDSPDVPGNTLSYTLEDIYKRLDSGAAGAQSTFTEPAAGPGTGTMHDLNEIMDEAPAIDNTDGATETNVLDGKTFWGLTDGQWGLQTGNIHTQTASNTTVSQLAGYYDAFDLSVVDTDLVSGNIRSTVSIYGVDGDPMVVNTSSGTATASDILSDTVAYVDGLEITGTMTNNVAVTIVPTTTNQAINAGYHNGSGYVEGDADLVADKIKSGVDIFGVTGSYAGTSCTGDATTTDVLYPKTFSNSSSMGLTGELYGGCTCTGIITPTGGTRWCDNGDGTVTDLTTCLGWLKDASWGGAWPWRDPDSWDDAHSRAIFCGEHMDNWRLPTLAELLGLTHGTEPVLSSSPRAFTGVQEHRYWTSTTGLGDTHGAWAVALWSGEEIAGGKMNPLWVWPVRGGQ